MRIIPAMIVSVTMIVTPLLSGQALATQTEPLKTQTFALSPLPFSTLVALTTVVDTEVTPVRALVAVVRHGLTAERIADEKQAEQERIEALKRDIHRVKRLERKRSHVDTTGYDWIYMEAEEKYGVPWQILSAVHQTETGRRGNTTVASYAGAQGPMQFMPATWRAYGQDGDGDGVANIHDVDDAIHGAANYLAANGANRGQVRNALYRYNHSEAYVNLVLSRAYAVGYNQ